MSYTALAMFTQADYRRLPEGFPAQLVAGDLVKEAAPTAWHQHLVLRIATALQEATSRDRVLVSPIDVFIDEHNVLQPDVLLLDERHPVVPGQREVAMPRLVVEVLSPSTAELDRAPKTAIYLDAGIEEVWLVDPDARTIEVRRVNAAVTYEADDTLRSVIAPHLSLGLSELFAG